MDLEDRRVICKVCLTQFARYICPRCNVSYCCLACYKQHSSSCTEAFYRDHAVQQLQSTRAEPQKKRELIALLKHVQEQQVRDEAFQEQLLAEAQAGGSLSLLSEQQPDDTDASEGSFEDSQSCDYDEGEDGGSEEDDEAEATDSDTENTTPANGHHLAPSHPTQTWHVNKQQSATSIPQQQPSVQQASIASGTRASSGSRLSKQTLRRLMRKLRATSLDEVTIDESDLTPDELQAFHRLLAAGGLSHLFTPWQPWWLTPEARDVTLGPSGQAVVQEVDASSTTTNQLRALPPGPAKPLQPLASLTRVPPSPLIKWQLLQLLYTYCYVQRRYNGEAVHPDTVQEAAQHMLAVSPALAVAAAAVSKPKPTGEQLQAADTQGCCSTEESGRTTTRSQSPSPATSINTQPASQRQSSSAPSPATAAWAPPTTCPEALLQCVQAACSPPEGDGSYRPFAVSVISDVAVLLELGAACVVLALCDMQHVLEEAAQQLRAASGSNSKDSPAAGGVDRAVPPAGVKPARASGAMGQTGADLRVPHGPQSGSKRALLAAVQKLWFLMCWAHEHRDDGLFEAELAPLVQLEWQQHTAAVAAPHPAQDKQVKLH